MTAPWILDHIGVPADATRAPRGAPPVIPQPSVRGVEQFGPSIEQGRTWLQRLVEGPQVGPTPLQLARGAEPLNLQVGAIPDYVGGPAKGLTGEGLLKLLKESQGFTVNQAGKALTKGFSVGAGEELGHVIKKPIEQLTAQELDQFLSKVPKGHAIGGWLDNGMAYIEPTNILTNRRKAFELASKRGEKAFGDLGKYAAGEDGTHWIPQPEKFDFTHYSNQEGLTTLDPKYAGKGPAAGPERHRSDRVPAIHVYEAGQKPEPLVVQSAGYTYKGSAEGRIYDLAKDPAGLMDEVAPSQMEKYLKKQGYAGYKDAGTILLFDKTPVEATGYTRLKGKGFKVEPVSAPLVREILGIPQVPLPRQAPARGIDPAILKSVNSSMRSATEAVKRGMEAGGLDWFDLSSLRADLQAAQGAKAGDEAFTRLTHAIAATSPRSTVASNIKRGSAMAHIIGTGGELPLTNADIAERLGPGYGHLAHTSHIPALRDLQRLGSITANLESVFQRPKISSFGENLRGNLAPVTVDTHAARSFGLNETQVKPGYTVVENALREIAAKLGIEPAQAQASAWIGNAEKTGVVDPQPFMQLMRGMIGPRAKALGMTPEDFWAAFLQGKAHF